jgi:hypothetical protein
MRSPATDQFDWLPYSCNDVCNVRSAFVIDGGFESFASFAKIFSTLLLSTNQHDETVRNKKQERKTSVRVQAFTAFCCDDEIPPNISRSNLYTTNTIHPHLPEGKQEENQTNNNGGFQFCEKKKKNTTLKKTKTCLTCLAQKKRKAVETPLLSLG